MSVEMVSAWLACQTATSQHSFRPSDPAVLGSVAPTPHHTPLLSSQTLWVGAIWVQVVPLYWQGPLISPPACRLVPISVKFDFRILDCEGLTRYGSIDAESTVRGTLLWTSMPAS